MRLRRSKRRTSPQRLTALLMLLGALSGAVAAVARRRRASAQGPADGGSSSSSSSAPSGAREDAGAPPSDAPAGEVVEHTFTCECGQEYRVSGQDRHRVYWPKDAEVGDPVLGQTCPECDRPLPHDHPTAAA